MIEQFQERENELLMQANGGFKALGWARMVSKFMKNNITLKLYNDISSYGSVESQKYPGFTFTEENCPEICQYISEKFFVIERQHIENEVNFSPAVIKVLGRNGLYVNNVFLKNGEQKILKNFDFIKFSPWNALFQFLDDRDFETKNIPNRVLKKYHIERRIGAGGQSTVRLVHNFATSGRFAMKMITKEPFDEETKHAYYKRLQHMHDEVKVMQSLHHPNVIKFVEYYETPEDLLIIMELAEGGNLFEYMNNFSHNRLPEDEAKYCFFQIGNGLRHVHKLNIAHRDLKVDNIFVAKTDRGIIFKIGDFGYAKNASFLSTQLGTPCYFPPEIQENRQQYTIAADIWTLGCLFFACLSGSFPFHSNYGSSIAYQIAHADLNFERQACWQQVKSH